MDRYSVVILSVLLVMEWLNLGVAKYRLITDTDARSSNVEDGSYSIRIRFDVKIVNLALDNLMMDDGFATGL